MSSSLRLRHGRCLASARLRNSQNVKMMTELLVNDEMTERISLICSHRPTECVRVIVPVGVEWIVAKKKGPMLERVGKALSEVR